MNKIIKDQYYESRGGYLRALEITCRSCGGFISYYQKDGPGNLRRMYLDRMSQPSLPNYWRTECEKLTPVRCPHCQKLLGTCYIYEKEDREAIILYQDAVKKKIVKQTVLRD